MKMGANANTVRKSTPLKVGNREKAGKERQSCEKEKATTYTTIL